jgi:hypothetical protein
MKATRPGSKPILLWSSDELEFRRWKKQLEDRGWLVEVSR